MAQTMIRTVFACMVLLLAWAAAARQLEGNAEAAVPGSPLLVRQQLSSPALQGKQRFLYSAALHNSSCHGFLIGIGTQKGGTTALWAYIANNAHPHLRVSKTKELGFWDNLHTRYAGCRVGDYLQLQTMDELQDDDAPVLQQQQQEQHSRAVQGQLPLCKAASDLKLTQQTLQQGQHVGWTTSSVARLLPSNDCSIMQRVRRAQTGDSGTLQGSIPNSMPAPAATTSTSTSAPLGSFNLHDSRCPQGLFLPGDVIPPKPWWWFWAKWPSAPDTSCLRKGGDEQPHAKPASIPDDYVPGSVPAVGSARMLLQQQADMQDPVSDWASTQRQVLTSAATDAPLMSIVGAAAQLELPKLQRVQPMYHADITPRYLFDPAVPPKVHSLLPEARIVVILRDPVSRAVSNFNMWWQKHAAKNNTGRVTTWSETLAAQIDGEIARLSACYSSVGSAPATQPELSACLGLQHPYSQGYDEALFANRLLAQGIYADGLQRWFQLFPAESFLIWISEDFKSKAAAHMRDLTSWLGLHTELLSPQLQDGSSKLKAVHGRHYEGSPDAEVVARMGRFFEPHNRRLFELLEAKGFRAVAARMRKVWLQ